MRIWVDADACPRVIKEVLFRAAERVRVPLTLVANMELHVPRSAWVRSIRVPSGFDQADHHIVRSMEPGDLVVTADVPLAAEALKKGGHALDPRGVLYTPENIPERLAMRNLLDQLRGSGVVTGGPAALGKGERQAFASRLDQLLTRYGAGRGAR
jgi:uncharacterized protein YaiI (UPF0178 family)